MGLITVFEELQDDPQVVYTYEDGGRTVNVTSYPSGVSKGWECPDAIATGSDKIYFEISFSAGCNIQLLGLANELAWDEYNYLYPSGDVNCSGNTDSGYADTWDSTNIIGVAFDRATGKTWFSIDGVWQDSGDPAAGTGNVQWVLQYDVVPMINYEMGTTGKTTISSSSINCQYTPPTGFNYFNLSEISTQMPVMTSDITGIFDSGEEFTGDIDAEYGPITGHITTAVAAKIHGRWAPDQKITSRIIAGSFINAQLPEMTSAISAVGGVSASINTKLNSITGKLVPGSRLSTTLMSLTSSFSVQISNVATISAKLPVMVSRISTRPDRTAAINGTMPFYQGNISGFFTFPAQIHAKLPRLESSINNQIGATASLVGFLPELQSSFYAWQSSASINASLPAITAKLSVQVDGDLDYGVMRHERRKIR